MPIFTAIAAATLAFIGVTSTFAVAATAFVLQTAAGIGLSLLASAIAGKPKQPGAASFAVQGKLQAAGDLPRSVMMGWYATAGSLVYANTWGNVGGTPNAYFTEVIACSDLPVAGLAAVWVDGKKCTLLTGEADASKGIPVSEYRVGSVDYLWIKFYDGTQTAADAFLTGTVASSDRPYESTRIGTGIAYAICTARVNQNLFSGFPAFKFEINGLKLYDPSQDSTVGGSGTHRYDDPSTWGGDGDLLPAVQAYNILRGLTFGGQWFYGLQNVTAQRFPIADWIVQIGKCRAPITGASGPEPTYRSGGEIQVSATIADTITALMTACQGKICETGGIYKMHCGAPDAAVFAFDDDFILSTEEQSFSPFFGLSDTINGITASYPAPDQSWNMTAAPPLYNSGFEVEDGNRRLLADNQIGLVPYDEQVQRLMNSALAEARRARRHTFVLPPDAWILEPGDYVTWNSERNGYDAKLFRVDGVSDKANLDVILDMTEVDPSDYDWNSAEQFHPPVNGPVGPVRPAPQAIQDWFAEAITIGGDGPQRRAGIRLHWDGSVDDVDAVLFDVRRFGATDPFYSGSTNAVARGAIDISQSIVASTHYQVRGQYWSVSGRPFLQSAWLDVTTPEILISGLELEDKAIDENKLVENQRIAQMQDLIKSLIANIDDLTSAVLRGNVQRNTLIRQVASSYQAQDLLLKADYTELVDTEVNEREALAETVTTLTASYNALFAQVQIINTAYQSADTSLASSITQVQTNLNGTNATVSTQGSAISSLQGDVSSLATSVTAVTATANGGTANGSFRITAMAANAGASSSFDLELSAAGPTGTFTTIGEQLDVLGDGTNRVLFLTDRFAIKGAFGGQYVFQTVPDGSILLQGVTRISSIIQSLGVGGNGQPYRQDNFGSAPYTIYDDGA